jgi:His-Xaa-Ser system radical SAM maturase HxsC
MIPLRLKAETGAADPFVVRLRSACGDENERSVDDALLMRAEGTSLDYATRRGLLRLANATADDIDGDVLLVVPRRQIAHRLIRARSLHNSLLVTERCDQLCQMCSQPPKDHHVDLFPLFAQAARLAPTRATIGVTGGEPTLYKSDLFQFLIAVGEARPDLRFHVLTNAQHFVDDDIDALQRVASRTLWGVPLYADKAEMHDDIVGKQGAFDRLQRSLAILARAGASIELRTVVLTANAAALPRLARFLKAHVPFITFWAIMQLENIGYGKKNWRSLFFDSSTHFTPIGMAVDIARASGLEVSLYNFPLCTVPAPYRRFAAASIADWKRRFLPICEPCRLRETCGGFFHWYPEANGFAGLEQQ